MRRNNEVGDDKIHSELCGYPKDGSLAAKFVWWYNHAWSDRVSRNLVVQDLYIPGRLLFDPPISAHDWDILITHIANTIQGVDGVRCMLDPTRFAYACGIITPIAMGARIFCRPLIFIPLNIAQRLLIYTTLTLTFARFYQHYRYPTTFHDLKSVVEFLHKGLPQLEKNVEEVMRRGWKADLI
ncbi:hypothetical protein BD414DRAFT_540971 [Trametes punicea]|nr:hypothetical protein BD414DRAFT_540971 [Trametes punicea]